MDQSEPESSSPSLEAAVVLGRVVMCGFCRHHFLKQKQKTQRITQGAMFVGSDGS